MNTFQITQMALTDYKNDKLSDERFDFLVAQANEQIDEISQNKEIYDSFFTKLNAPKKTDNIILWVLIMSNEELCKWIPRAKLYPEADILMVYSMYGHTFLLASSSKDTTTPGCYKIPSITTSGIPTFYFITGIVGIVVGLIMVVLVVWTTNLFSHKNAIAKPVTDQKGSEA